MIEDKYIARFKRYFESSGSRCWNWTAYKNRQGYGTFRYKDKKWQANRFSYQIFVGNIPESMCVCHKCDNPSCVNPKHLFLGTKLDNKMDCVEKGRHAHGDSHWTHQYPERVIRGKNHPRWINPIICTFCGEVITVKSKSGIRKPDPSTKRHRRCRFKTSNAPTLA